MVNLTDWRPPDVLSAAAKQVLDLNGDEAYGRLTPTGSGKASARAALERLRADQLFTSEVRSPDDARAALAGLWLYHDFLDESHAISQELRSATGSFWHAIMHRREGDFSNAKYWYARCRHHPAFGAIALQGRAAIDRVEGCHPLGQLVRDEWDPDGFVDIVEGVHHRPNDPLYEPAVRLQRVEWRVLFARCVAVAAEL